MSKMMALARTIMWWPKLDTDVEELVRGSTKCQLTRPMPPTSPLNPLPWPAKPWSRIHVDFVDLF